MGESDLMLDTHAVARSLTAADFTPAQADALTDALRLVVEQGDHVTSDQFKVGMAEMRTEIAEVRTEIANLDSRLSTQISAHWDILITSASSWLSRRDDRVSPRRSSPGNRCFRVLRGVLFMLPLPSYPPAAAPGPVGPRGGRHGGGPGHCPRGRVTGARGGPASRTRAAIDARDGV